MKPASYHRRCYAPGLVGWTLRHAHLELSRYKYFVWLDSSVRGPFLPAYVKESQVGGLPGLALGAVRCQARGSLRGLQGLLASAAGAECG